MRSRLSEILLDQMADYAVALDRSRNRKAKVRRKGSIRSQLRERRELEKVLIIGNWLYRSLRLIERHWRTAVLEGKMPYDSKEEASILDLYRQWSAPCARCLAKIRSLRSRGARVRESKPFERYCEEAARILEGKNPFFDDVEMGGRWAAITAPSRESPRPVRVDEQGRIFELTGQRFVMPGLAPDEVLQGMADAEAGRTKPLKDIIAARGGHGL